MTSQTFGAVFRTISFALMVMNATACGEVVSSSGTDAGMAPGSDASPGTTIVEAGPLPEASTSGFCTGNVPKMRINGEEVGVMTVEGQSMALGCCDSAMLTLGTDRYAALFHLLWRSPAGAPLGSIDLTAPPSGFSIEFVVGCDPSKGSCAATAGERYVSGFQGTVSYTTSTEPEASYCVSARESVGDPHPVMHSLEIYAPKVPSPY